MKIGFARRGFSGTGGAEAYLKRFALALVKGGHDAILFGSDDWPRHAWPGREVQMLPGHSPRAFADALARSDFQTRCDYLFSLERVWKCDCYRAGDGVHRAWLKRREAFEPAWKRWGRVFNGKHRELLALEARLFTPEGAGAVITNSRMVKEEIVRHYAYPADRIHVIYNGLARPRKEACREKDRARLRAELGLSETDYLLLFVGSGWERKGLRFAIEGLRRARLPRAVLLVAGKGNRRSYPSCKNVRFAGPVKGIEAYYAAADAFILPTLYDPFSNACLEAMAAGLPVITTRSNGFSEIIRPGVEGEALEDPADAGAMAQAIEAWSDPQRREAIRPRLTELAASFSIEENVRATLKVITGEA